MKNIVSAMLKTEPKAAKRSLALVILSIVSGYFPIVHFFSAAKVQKIIIFAAVKLVMKLLKRLLGYLKHYKPQIAWVLVTNLLYSFFSIFTLSMIVPFLSVLFDQVGPAPTKPTFSLTSQFFIDTFYYYMNVVVTHFGKMSALFYIAGVMVLLSLLSNLCRYMGHYWLAPMRSGILHDVRNDMYHNILKLPLSFYSKQRKGDIMSRIGSDVIEVEWSIFASLQSLCRDPFLIVVFLGVLFSINVKLTLISLVIIPSMGYLLAVIGKNIKRYAKSSQQLLGKMSSLFEEAVGGLRVIKGYNAIDHASEKFRKEDFKFYRLNKKLFRINELGAPLIEFLCILALMGITLIAMVAFPDLSLTNGSVFMLYFVVFARLIVPAKAVVTTYYTLQKGLSAASRVYEIVDAVVTIREAENPVHKATLDDKIEYKNVSFSYHDVENETECDILHHIDLTINKGETVALVGPSGSGKSTMVDLLPRFYNVSFGQILIDGVPNDQMAIRDLHALFGIVSQDVILFHDTVFNNIAFGMDDVTEEQVVAAAKVAQAHDFIMEMEEGYNTVIGDRGLRLSGGQRQRISIARALLRQPQVLILDEATSALDNESEHLFQEALLTLVKDHTAIIIAHRLSTIRFADIICFVKDGRIVERGSHQELMEKKGAYYNFYTAQA